MYRSGIDNHITRFAKIRRDIINGPCGRGSAANGKIIVIAVTIEVGQAGKPAERRADRNDIGALGRVRIDIEVIGSIARRATVIVEPDVVDFRADIRPSRNVGDLVLVRDSCRVLTRGCNLGIVESAVPVSINCFVKQKLRRTDIADLFERDVLIADGNRIWLLKNNAVHFRYDCTFNICLKVSRRIGAWITLELDIDPYNHLLTGFKICDLHRAKEF